MMCGDMSNTQWETRNSSGHWESCFSTPLQFFSWGSFSHTQEMLMVQVSQSTAPSGQSDWFKNGIGPKQASESSPLSPASFTGRPHGKTTILGRHMAKEPKLFECSQLRLQTHEWRKFLGDLSHRIIWLQLSEEPQIRTAWLKPKQPSNS